jgi:hypothetical protein
MRIGRIRPRSLGQAPKSVKSPDEQTKQKLRIAGKKAHKKLTGYSTPKAYYKDAGKQHLSLYTKVENVDRTNKRLGINRKTRKKVREGVHGAGLFFIPTKKLRF